MKKILNFTILFFLFFQKIVSQNIGINTVFPKSTLQTNGQIQADSLLIASAINTNKNAFKIGVYPAIQDQESPLGVGASYWNDISNAEWQSFTAGTTGTLSSITILFFFNNVPVVNRVLKIYDGEGTGGTLLTTLNWTTPAYSGSLANYQNSPNLNIPIVAGQKYTFWLDNQSYCLIKQNNPYPSGQSSNPNNDLIFTTYVVPENSFIEKTNIKYNGDIETVGNLKLNGNNNAIKYNSKEANNDWRLVYVDDFNDNTAQGWNAYSSYNNTTPIPPMILNNPTLQFVLSNYNLTDNNYVFKKLYDMAGITFSTVRVKFNYVAIDDWAAGEIGWLGKGNNLGSEPNIIWYKEFTEVLLRYNATTSSNSYIGGISSDVAYTAEATFPDTNNFTLTFGNSCNGTTGQKSFAIDNIEIWVK
jgi:hypothetical protein